MTRPPVALVAAAPARALVPVAVLIVDDQPAVREGLARLMACAPFAIRSVGTAATGAEALTLAATLVPDVVVLDVDLAGEDGLALIGRLGPRAAVLVLTCHGDAGTRERAARLGASAFLEKHQPAAELLGVIARIAARNGGEEPPDPAGESTRGTGVQSSAAPEATRP